MFQHQGLRWIQPIRSPRLRIGAFEVGLISAFVTGAIVFSLSANSHTAPISQVAAAQAPTISRPGEDIGAARGYKILAEVVVTESRPGEDLGPARAFSTTAAVPAIGVRTNLPGRAIQDSDAVPVGLSLTNRLRYYAM